jgi:hypothetical protein
MASTKVAQTKIAQHNQEETETPAVEQAEAHHPRTATVHLPFVTAEFRAPDLHLPSVPVHMPDRSDLSGAVSSIRSRLPSPEQAVYYVGLGLLGALEIIEWPVAVAIAVGTAIARRPGATQIEPEGNGREPADEEQEDRPQTRH